MLNDDEYADYEEAVWELQAEFKKGRKGGRNQARMKELMDKTRKGRQLWIQHDRPLVTEVVEKFPCLATSKMVSVTACHFT